MKNKKFLIEKIIFVGSRTRGNNLKESDYDFIIVSKDFSGIFFTQRNAMLYKYWKSPYFLEALCYTPDEFKRKRKEIGIVREALRNGIEIKI